MASYRRRGAHAATRGGAAPFVAAKRVPQLAASGRALLKGGTGGTRLGGLRSRAPLLKLCAAVIAVGVLIAGVVSGFSGEPSAEPAAQAFLLAWGEGQYQAAAALTTGQPSAVTTALRTAYQQLGAAAFYLSMGRIRQGHGTAQAAFYASVDLGQDGAPWNYRGVFKLRETSAGWRVVWAPSVINPGLRPGLRMAVMSRMPLRAQLLDTAGQPLTRLSAGFVAEVRPGGLRSPQATARTFGRVTGLDPGQVLGVILAAPRSALLKLVTLDPATYRKLQPKLDRVPGLVIHKVTRRLFDSAASDITGTVGTEASLALREEGIAYRPGTTIGLSGLQEVYQRKLAGTASTEVIAENRSGHQVAVLARWAGLRGTAVKTTIDTGVQAAAARALAGQSTAAGIVAVQTSTGRILAVADHPVGGVTVDPLGGHYQPGDAFTIVSTAALLSSGLPANTPIPCTSSNQVGGRTFTNVPTEPQLGPQPPFSTDFAHACGTAFTGLSRRLTGADLSSTAARFGLGAGWKLPLSAFAGSFRPAGNDAGLAADTIGAAGVQVSPLAMALVAAGAASGTWHPPMLVTDPPDPGLTPKAVGSTQMVGTLRALMRATVTSGAAHQADLAGAPVYGQVGNAVAAAGSHLWASWFVGYRGDVAFAVLELTRSPSNSAVPLGTSFLAGLPRG